jgi:leucyl aminopeptidase
MEAIARLKPPLRVTAVVCTAQNYVDSRSIVPGDIMRARNGKTIHIDNTDAEGRLVLTDGLWRMGEEKVTHLVDLATLTGAIVRALGSSLSGAFGNDDFADRVARIAGDCGEPCWRMPMVEEYRDLLDCDVADLNNIGSTPNGGAISAALFLREFVPEGIHWTHLDIAGTFLVDKGWKYFGAGATGVMVRTLTGLAEAMASEKRG